MVKDIIRIVALAILLFVGACGEKKPDANAANTKEAVIKKYACPHHCEAGKTYDNPGKCPVCSRELEEIGTR